MGRRPGRDRVLKGHVAAVYGLRLAGVSVVECGLIVGASPKRLKAYIAPDWWDRKIYRPRTRWQGDALRALAAAYENHSIGVREIMAAHKITQASLYKLAQRYRWPLRPKGPKPKALAVRNLSGGRYAYYRKLRANGLSLVDALAAAQRGAEPVHSADSPQGSAPLVVTPERARPPAFPKGEDAPNS